MAIIPINKLLVVYYIVPAPTVNVGGIGSEIAGTSISVECNVTAVNGINGSMDIIWTRDDEEVLTENGVVGYPVNDTGLLLYTSLYNITVLQMIDDDITYHCQAVINTTPMMNNSDNYTLNVLSEYIPLYYVTAQYFSCVYIYIYACYAMQCNNGTYAYQL